MMGSLPAGRIGARPVMRMFRMHRLELLLLSVLLVPISSVATPGAVADTGQPGDVVSAAPAVFTMDPVLHLPMPGVTATRILYRSTNATGSPNVVSGTVLVPALPYLAGGRRPLVSYAVGTQGLGDACAPSNQMAVGTETEAGVIEGMLLRGWAVAVTDYEGLGTPGQHTYVVGPSLGHAVLDVARAAIRLPATGLAADTPLTIWGYSEGGAASSWAAQLQPSYAPELRLRGVATGGVPADIVATARNLDGGAFFGFGMAAIIGLDAAHPALHLSNYLNATGSQLVAAHQNDCLVGLITAFALKHYRDITTTDVLALPDWQAAFAESRLGATAPQVPILQYHGLIDEVIPYAVGKNLRNEWCRRGVTDQFDTYPTDHVAGVVAGAPAAMLWLAARIAGVPAPSNCSSP
jgi:hypothetical protein